MDSNQAKDEQVQWAFLPLCSDINPTKCEQEDLVVCSYMTAEESSFMHRLILSLRVFTMNSGRRQCVR